MSWLTGDPRAATITAIDDVLVFELDDTVLRELASASVSVLDTLAQAVSTRRQQLQSISAGTAAGLKAEARSRADRGGFFGHIAYASLLATRIP